MSFCQRGYFSSWPKMYLYKLDWEGGLKNIQSNYSHTEIKNEHSKEKKAGYLSESYWYPQITAFSDSVSAQADG